MCIRDSVKAARSEAVAPRFEIVRGWDVPLAQRRGRILVVTQPNDIGDSLLQVGPVDRKLCFAIQRDRTWRVVDGIAAENEELLNPSGVDIARQLQNAARALARR